jgi:diguanylate cyclase (GGDEF)-like protein
MTTGRTLAMSDRELLAARQQTRLLETQLSLLRAELRLLAQSNAETHRRAHFDALTGLPNRFLLLDRFHQAVAHATRMRTQLALLYLDLDGFKAVNDALGHATGDELLMRVAARLLDCIRASDTASRQGGDEFVVLLTEVADDAGALLAAEKIRAQLAMPYVVGGSAIQMTASIGVAVYPIDGREHSELLQRSDLAMFRNKGAMSNRPSIVRLDQTLSATPRFHTWGSEPAGEKDGSPPGECCEEPKYDESL